MESTRGSVIIKPDRKVFYPVGSDDKGGCLMLFGKPDADHLAILCAGFPNDHKVFFPLASRLATEANCLAGVMCIPGYDDLPPEKPWQSHPRDGYGFEDWVQSVREATKALRKCCDSASASNLEKKTTLTGIFHDWGVIPGLMHTNRSLQENLDDSVGVVVDQLVLFDVAVEVHPDDAPLVVPPKQSLFRQACEAIQTWSYRFVFAKTFFIQRYVSKTLALVLFGLNFMALKLVGLSPGRKVDDASVHEYPVDDPYRFMYMMYPYYGMFRSMLSGNFKRDFYGCHLPRDLKKTPVLFMYGLDKSFMFHPQSAVLALEEEKKHGRKSNAIGVENAGHWLYLQQPDMCFAAIKEFMSI